MRFKISTAPFIHQGNSVTKTMHQVIYALIPGIAMYVYFFGFAVIITIILACITALICEFFILWIRRKPILPFLTDCSALVTALLLAVAIPPFLPWWMTVIGISFGIIFAKHLYGGLGYNPFNPAVVGYVVLLISFPVEMTQWPALSTLGYNYAGILDSFSIIFYGHPTGGLPLDSFTGATVLDTMKTELGQFHTVNEIKAKPMFGFLGATGWEWINLTFLLGGCWLMYKRVITWHIPIAVLTGLFVIASLFFIIDSDIYPSPIFHIFSGAAIVGAFFIATDPVTAATSNQGRLIFGVGIGLLIYITRTWGGYPDGMAFAILLMNMSVPVIDYYTKPQVFGH
ncbi:electron transport complex subunit RsxD [Candidatus Halobeggiatoa sp. HSG11]|nr:electron transport complex subunit RsxD [Candidatus Halobeggiatoa sp. HSG11]